MEFIRVAKKVGNSSGVVLPKKLLGSEVRITVVNRPVNPKKEALKLVSEYLPDILGIYVISKKPLEVLAVSYNLKHLLETERIKVIIMPLSLLKKDMKNNFVLRAKLVKAGTILNRILLAELQKEARSFR